MPRQGIGYWTLTAEAAHWLSLATSWDTIAPFTKSTVIITKPQLTDLTGISSRQHYLRLTHDLGNYRIFHHVAVRRACGLLVPGANIKNGDWMTNNYNLLRLMFALTVVFAHIYALSLNKNLLFLQEIFDTRTAVFGFFVISGFFVFESYEKRGIRNYAVRRFLRIYPLYAFSVCYFAFLLFPYGTGLLSDYFKYLVCNLLFLNFLFPSFPVVFASNPIQAINGALWAVRTEVLFYLLVPGIVFLYRKSNKVLAAIYLIAVGTAIFLQQLEFGNQLYHYARIEIALPLAYFIAGAIIYYQFKPFKGHIEVIMISALIVMAFNLTLLKPLAFAVIVVYLGSILPYLGKVRCSNLTYGIFIFHFPVIQMLVSWGVI
jgi:peptidoglycan/LPS O-acetylase OafA/YrhL